MDKNLITNDQEPIDVIEIEIAKDLHANLRMRNEISAAVLKLTEQRRGLFYQKLSELEDCEIDPESLGKSKIRKESFYAALDAVFGNPGALIRPSQEDRPYSLLKLYPDTRSLVPKIDGDFLSKLFAGAEIRSNEILREFSAENTERAFNGDLVYWQAWLAAIGYDFESPLTAEHVKLFAIQHIEGIPTEIDQKLVNQRYKQALGPHRISTVKRRLASLSVALELKNLPNPTKVREFRRIIEKLSKKYGETRRKGRAITRDILFAILDTCGNDLIDVRDRALILFGWASGGRRRSEIADAELKDLEVAGENFIYHLPRSKTDQQGKGKTLPVNGMAATALKEWIQRSGVVEGKIFRSVSKAGRVGDMITTVDINRIVKRRCKKAGYDPKLYSAHSLRSGFITEAGRQRCPIGDAMELSDHKSVSIAMRYYQAGSVTNNSAANLV